MANEAKAIAKLNDLVSDLNNCTAELLTMPLRAVRGARWRNLATRRARLVAQVEKLRGRHASEGNLNALILGIKPGGVSSKSQN